MTALKFLPNDLVLLQRKYQLEKRQAMLHA
jgi:hypothetical protein